MSESSYYYEVQLPLVGHPDNWFTVVRCVSADGAAEVVRILLAQHDKGIGELCVRVRIGMPV